MRFADAELPPRTEPFDAALGLNVLHLCSDLDAVVRQVHALVAPGGVFVSSTPCVAETARYLALVLPVTTTLGLAPPVNVFDVATLQRSITGAGFEIEEQSIPGRDRNVCFIIAKR